MKTWNGQKCIRVAALILVDVVFMSASVFLSLFIRFNFEGNAIPALFLARAIRTLPAFCVCSVLIFARLRLYSSLWSYASLREAAQTVLACAVSSALLAVMSYLMNQMLPRSCYFVQFSLLTMLTIVLRFSYRLARMLRDKMNHHAQRRSAALTNVMIIGAGSAASALINEISHDSHLTQSKVVCVMDDASAKQGHYFCGVKVVGDMQSIPRAAERYAVDEIIFAIPSATSQRRKEILQICQQTACRLKTLPGIYQLVDGEVSMSKVRKVEVTDLLGREAVKLDMAGIRSLVCGTCVLITGAAGSIGSELSRQIAGYQPRMLVLLDMYENTLYFLENELKKAFPTLHLVTLIGSVRDERRLESVFSAYHPELVFHAAAHKHVPLMEDSPHEAIKNNVFGTLNVVKMADRYQVKRFVMISTDKAVNPTNVMGATKRICEMIIQTYNMRSKTEYVAVRFGNVLGSNGSVIPIFRRQIDEGGPVTVTHPDIIRYFMTIPEAVSLVLQAGAFAKGGEIFVLDMGEPVKILTLAENMIRLSGYVPYQDIQIQFSGLRPGEKLYEEMLMSEEGLIETENKQIYIGKPLEINAAAFYAELDALQALAGDEKADVRAALAQIVPTCRFGQQQSRAERPVSPQWR
ncbi:MAG: nucleoside-diphosphate sugar epimerase/dehydratase [Oscillospiraceae bacterium]|nr:nucleoside-diphosphate sugar epimerase/dehydratase [Oscillospiraceae bacterium]